MKIDWTYLSHLRFADAVVYLSQITDELQGVIKELSMVSTAMALSMNKKKCNDKRTNSHEHRNIRNPSGKLDGYVYLGQTLTRERKRQ